MASRLNLQEEFEAILGTRNVYFDPPTSIKISYPCIIYKLSKHNSTYANGKKYVKKTSYDVILVDKNPDSTYCQAIEDMEYCTHDRTYRTDGLSHYAYTLFY